MFRERHSPCPQKLLEGPDEDSGVTGLWHSAVGEQKGLPVVGDHVTLKEPQEGPYPNLGLECFPEAET